VGDLRALIAKVNTPLAVRSSSMLEDARYEPFAGVYATKMIPNNQPDTDTRFRKLIAAIKYVYASTFFKEAKDYIKMTSHSIADEKMAVIIQEVVGLRHGDRYYPHISGVARSYNFYSSGHARPEDGVIDLALGLGKTIVDGGKVWTYSPAYPRSNPPYNSLGDLCRQTQTEFWAVNMGKPPAYDPIQETEYLQKCDLSDAEMDNTLRFVASTYQRENDRLVMGTGSPGTRILTFAPLITAGQIPVNELLKNLITLSEEAAESPVEIEFAMTFDHHSDQPARFGYLQVRPMVISQEDVNIDLSDLQGEKVLVAAEQVLGNGVIDTIEDIVYVKPEPFAACDTRIIALQLETINQKLIDAGRSYLLIGFGRWGSSEPWLGIPVKWSQINGAKVIVEATLPEMDVELSQGSHFFHNLTSFQVLYFSMPHNGKYNIDWPWLNKQKVISETEFVRHIHTEKPLGIKMDGRRGRGVILK
ncbi:MAG: hypothetical protein NTV06_06585, partial [candidate division Zixibacteria bacterium]|nr:hypothetical protein [candidate division Zixibacteria bacterium]